MNQNTSSSKTSKESSVKNLQDPFGGILKERRYSFMSSENWKEEVTKCRGEYSRRLKSARRISESGFLSWGTPNTMDHMNLRSPEALKRQSATARRGRTRPANLREQVDPESVEIYKRNWQTASVSTGGHRQKDGSMTAKLDQQVKQNWGTPRVTTNGGTPSPDVTGKGSRLEDQVAMKNWPTAAARDWKDTPGMAQDALDKSGKFRNRIDQLAGSVYHYGQPDQESHNTIGKSRESSSWPTSRVCGNNKSGGAPRSEFYAKMEPENYNAKKSGRLRPGHKRSSTKKLNPRWVCQLMGIPVDWVSLPNESHRVDELRLLGNGVVPQTAEKAFRILYEKLSKTQTREV